MRAVVLSLLVLLAPPPSARAQSVPPPLDNTAVEAGQAQMIAARRPLYGALLAGGAASLLIGGGLLIPSRDDQSLRVAGGVTAGFGAVNLLLGALALRSLNSDDAAFRAQRRDDASAVQAARDDLLRQRQQEAVVFGVVPQLDPSLAFHLGAHDHAATRIEHLILDHFTDLADRGHALLAPAYRAAAAAERALPAPRFSPIAPKVLAARLAPADPQSPVPSAIDDVEGWEPVYPVRPHPAWAFDAPLFQPPPGSPPLVAWAISNGADYLDLRPHPEDPDDDEHGYQARFHGAAFRYIGAVRALESTVHELIDRVAKRGEPLDPRLAAQLFSSGMSLSGAPGSLFSRLKPTIKVGAALEEHRLAQAAQHQADADSRLVVFGESQRPRLYTCIGIDRDGRHVAITAETPQIVLLLGGVGTGKSHLMRLIIEGVTLCAPGINSLERPQATVQSEVDYITGRGRRQMLHGFFPNTDPQQLEQLARDYSYQADGSECYHSGTLFCLPGAEQPLRDELGAYVERGLKIKPAVLGPEDLGSFGYRALLCGARSSGNDKPFYVEDLETILSDLGPVLPEELIKAIQGSKLRGRLGEGFIRKLKLIAPFVEQGARLNDCLLEPEPIFLLLESTTMTPDVLLPLQAVMMGAMSRPLRNGVIQLRWLGHDEFNKSGQNWAMVDRSNITAQEVRHGQTSFLANGQRPSGMDPGFLGMPTIIAVGRMVSSREIRMVKDKFSLLEPVPDQVFMTLGRGEFVMASTQSTAGQGVFIVRTRPSLIDAGETLRG